MFIGAIIAGLAIEMICQINGNRNFAKLAGLAGIFAGLIMIVMEKNDGAFWIIVGIYELIVGGQEEEFSLREAFKKYAYIFYIVSIICMVIGYFFISWLLVLGIALFVATIGGHCLCWLTSPIVFKIKSKDKK